jgi:hypothetical protein
MGNAHPPKLEGRLNTAYAGQMRAARSMRSYADRPTWLLEISVRSDALH